MFNGLIIFTQTKNESVLLGDVTPIDQGVIRQVCFQAGQDLRLCPPR